MRSIPRVKPSLRVLFVNHFPMETASFYRHIGLGTELVKRGHKVTLLTRLNPEAEYRKEGRRGPALSKGRWKDHAAQLEKERGVKIVFWREPFDYLSLLNSAQVFTCTKSVDVVHLNRAYPFSATPTLIARRLRPKPLVLDWDDWDGVGGWASLPHISRRHGSLVSKMVTTYFEEIVPPRSDVVVAVSKLLLQRAVAQGVPMERVYYLPNGVDTVEFNPHIDGSIVRDRLKLGRRPVVVALGVLYSYELLGIRIILEATSHVVREVKDVLLMVLGWGPALGKAEAMARKLGLEPNVLFTGRNVGFIPRPDIPGYLAAADVAIHVLDGRYPYYHACSPKSLSEFLAMGKAVVASDVGEAREALKDGAGILVSSERPEEYAKALLHLLGSPPEREVLGQRAREVAVSRYGFDVQSKMLEEAYEKALELHSKR